MANIFEQAETYYSRSLVETFFSAPGAFWSGSEYTTKSPFSNSEKIKAFSINVDKGVYRDCATDDSGSIIDLVAYVFSLNKAEAAKRIITEAGGAVEEEEYHGAPTHGKQELKPVNYIKGDDETKKKIAAFLKSAFLVKKHGACTKVYLYKDFQGKILFFTARFEKETEEKGKEKVVLPFMQMTDGSFQNKRRPMRLFPVYGCEKLKGNNLPVLIVEGEKCGDIEVAGYVVISFIGGSKAVEKTDWRVLEGRTVFIFPDIDIKREAKTGNIKRLEDQPGLESAIKIKNRVPSAKIVNIINVKKKLEAEKLLKDGWDIADGKEAGLDLPKMITESGFLYDINSSLDPYELHKVFINERYGFGNLDQIDGMFFNYKKDKHFWKVICPDNIKPDIKTWLEKRGIVELIMAEDDLKLKNIINDINYYVQSHALNYIEDNPFRDSAMRPYLHHKDGVVKIGYEGLEFFDRMDKPEAFFKELHPLVCVQYGTNEDIFNNLDVKRDCPAFYYYCSELIPDRIKGTPEAKEEIEKTVEMFSQIMAYCLSPVKKEQFFFSFTGQEQTGKTFFIDVIKDLIGEDFVLERPIEEMMNNRFSTSQFLNSKVYIEPDMAQDAFPENFVKKYAGEGSITIENKFENAIKGVKISIAMFLLGNNEIKAKTIEGFYRRLIPLKFENVIKHRDVFLRDKIKGERAHGKESGSRAGEMFDERPALIAFALHGWLSYVENDFKITLPRWVRETKVKWREEANSVSLFLSEEVLPNLSADLPFVRHTGKELFNQYSDFVREEGMAAYGRKRFYETIRLEKLVEETKGNGQVHFKIKNPEYISGESVGAYTPPPKPDQEDIF